MVNRDMDTRFRLVFGIFSVVRRCLDDVGDDWRSLLLGAPPARV